MFKSICGGFLFMLWLTIGVAHSQSTKQEHPAASYGVMVAFMGITIATFETCISDNRQTNDIKRSLVDEFSKWKLRHSYADQIRNRMNERAVERHGPVTAKENLAALLSMLDEHTKGKREEVFKNPSICPKFLVQVARKENDFHVIYRADYIVLTNQLKRN